MRSTTLVRWWALALVGMVLILQPLVGQADHPVADASTTEPQTPEHSQSGTDPTNEHATTTATTTTTTTSDVPLSVEAIKHASVPSNKRHYQEHHQHQQQHHHHESSNNSPKVANSQNLHARHQQEHGSETVVPEKMGSHRRPGVVVPPSGSNHEKGDASAPNTKALPMDAAKTKSTSVASPTTASVDVVDATAAEGQGVNPEDLKVISLTTRSFSRTIGDGNMWLIEFFAPWCSHCTTFAPTYSEIARQLHLQYMLSEKEFLLNGDKKDAQKKKKKMQRVKVAKVNADAEKALASRFGVQAFPTFYLVDGWTVYQFDGVRSRKAILDFVNGGYKKTEPLPFYTSPMGPIGQAQGIVISGGFLLSDIFHWLQTTFGFSQLFTGFIMFGAMFLGCFFLIVFLALAIPPKAKYD